MATPPRYIDILSDSSGATAERVVRAALLQFPGAGVEIRHHPRVRTKERAQPILDQVAADRSLLIFTVVSPELSAFIHQQTSAQHIDAIDVIGGVIGKLETYLEKRPINSPESSLPLSEEYFRRVEAVEFTVKADAGRDPRCFMDADLTLVGVSRTSKTPLATLLAQRGLKVANFTLVLGERPPAELERAPQDRVVGLTIDVESLCAIRQARLRKLGMPADAQYGVREHVARELAWADSVFAAHPTWPVLDMTGRTVDETAGLVLEAMAARVGKLWAS
ncbi:MAG TPA: kinase/pyrophosphorylase [Polyangiaceae bacterium]|nr:kinase/pyrophosphorylase [Polyangiaceae bacterium]